MLPEVLKELELELPVVGMVKDDRHRTSALINDNISISLKSEPSLMPLIAAIQEEVHCSQLVFTEVKS